MAVFTAGVLLQLLLQILYIAKSIRQVNRKPLLCVLYILSVTVFGLAAIAFYLLRAEKKLPKDTTTEKVEKANHLTNKGIFLLLLIAYQVMGIHMLAENYETSAYIPLIWLLTFSFLIMLLYNLLPEKSALEPNLFCRYCSLLFVYQSNTWILLAIICFFPSLRVLVPSTTHRYLVQRRMVWVQWAHIYWAAWQEQYICPVLVKLLI